MVWDGKKQRSLLEKNCWKLVDIFSKQAILQLMEQTTLKYTVDGGIGRLDFSENVNFMLEYKKRSIEPVPPV